MGESQEHRDIFKLSHDWLSVQEVVDTVSSSSCGAISVFIGLFFYCIYRIQISWTFIENKKSVSNIFLTFQEGLKSFYVKEKLAHKNIKLDFKFESVI